MKYILLGALAALLATIITAYAAPKCFAVCSNGECSQVCYQ